MRITFDIDVTPAQADDLAMVLAEYLLLVEGVAILDYSVGPRT